MILSVLVRLALAATSSAPSDTLQAWTIDGKSAGGAWAGISASGEIQLKTGDRLNLLKPDELMRLRWPAEPDRERHQLPTLFLLKDGSRFQARITGGDRKSLDLQTAVAAKLTCPVSQIAAIRFAVASQPAAQEAIDQAMAEPDPGQDRLIVVRNQRPTTLKGTVETIRPDGGSFRWRERTVPIRPDDACTVVFAAGKGEAKPAPSTCVLRDGTAWAGQIVGGSADSLQWQLGIGPVVALPIGQLSEIQFRSDRIVFLSDLAPANYQFEPFGNTQWPYRLNRSAANHPIRIGGQAFERGIGMHSKSTLTYDLKGEFTQLAATIGIDEAAGSLGNVIFRVTADGRTVFDSGPVAAGDKPRPILVPLKGARRIQLIVDFGENLDIGDQADWGDVRLIK
jgi:hypothetical protein